MVIEVLAEYRAKKIVKEQLRRAGIKVSSHTAAEITMARMYLELHAPELVADAKQMVASSPELTKLLEKEQRRSRSNQPVTFGQGCDCLGELGSIFLSSTLLPRRC